MVDVESQVKQDASAGKAKLTQWLAARPYRTLVVGAALGALASAVLAFAI